LVHVGPERTVVRSITEKRARGRPLSVTNIECSGGARQLQERLGRAG